MKPETLVSGYLIFIISLILLALYMTIYKSYKKNKKIKARAELKKKFRIVK